MKILGMGGFEFVIILIVVLIIFGPKNLPKLGKALGSTVSSLREGMNSGKKKDKAKEEAQDEAKDKAGELESANQGADFEPADSQADAEEGADGAARADQLVEDASEYFARDSDELDGGGLSDVAPEEAIASNQVAAEQPQKRVVKRVVKKKDASGEADSPAQ